jgi:hypothetical protein
MEHESTGRGCTLMIAAITASTSESTIRTTRIITTGMTTKIAPGEHFLTENPRESHEYAKSNRKEQSEYWNYRHNHPDKN